MTSEDHVPEFDGGGNPEEIAALLEGIRKGRADRDTSV
jgi:hypothetical protein